MKEQLPALAQALLEARFITKKRARAKMVGR
jgi:hypothetical protein